MYITAIDVYVKALLDIATALEQHREARTAFDVSFLSRVVLDGFLQTVTERERVLGCRSPNEEFLLWQGQVPGIAKNWNNIGWIFPFHGLQEMENSYEIVTRSEIAEKSWAGLRQFWLSCRLRVHEAALDLPANLVKIRVLGDECRSAMQVLREHPPDLRYVSRTLLERLPQKSPLKQRLHVKLILGEQLKPYAQAPR
ncbi:hypothetical protein CSB45_08585 [candidate division KSB3 bacterium]|uniref:Uncharacterized protein n=1 Tax=candidate division KSB3 bacterium TaxID=2044937 RepID=A0A2G6E5A1_9BACT|nr:MAG: hypothetical protein CSB45_08585 [candidate division KSB3 bacterium]PIE29728.1 MAG: hypothetical protein CSA57_06630 [candidate division KSB3 bacterium]